MGAGDQPAPIRAWDCSSASRVDARIQRDGHLVCLERPVRSAASAGQGPCRRSALPSSDHGSLAQPAGTEGRQESTSDPSAQFVHSSSHSLRLSILGVYVSIAPPGLVSLVARGSASPIGRAAEPRDDHQAQHYGQKAQDAVHCPASVTVCTSSQGPNGSLVPLCTLNTPFTRWNLYRIGHIGQGYGEGSSTRFRGHSSRPQELGVPLLT